MCGYRPKGVFEGIYNMNETTTKMNLPTKRPSDYTSIKELSLAIQGMVTGLNETYLIHGYLCQLSKLLISESYERGFNEGIKFENKRNK